jgi:hypothetical protein
MPDIDPTIGGTSAGPVNRFRRPAYIAAAALIGASMLCHGAMAQPAQTPVGPPTTPGPVIPERIHPPAGTPPQAGSGVIQPPGNVDPGIQATVPNPRPNSTPVIPPPGTPGGNPNVVPK